MKKLLLMLMLLMPFAVLADNAAQDSLYDFRILFEGKGNLVPGVTVTENKMTGLSYEMYTIAYTAAVDAMREILTKAWLLDTQGITVEDLARYTANPGLLLEE